MSKIKVISRGRNTAQIVIKTEGGSTTRHLQRNGRVYTDNYGNSYELPKEEQ
jgi:hypothetical protein